MPTYSVRGAGSKGYFSSQDIAPEFAPKESWTAVRDARMNNGSVETIGASKFSGIGMADGNPSDIDWVESSYGISYLLYTDKYVHQSLGYDVSTISNLVRYKGYYDDTFDEYPYAQPWVVSNLGGLPIATRGDTIYTSDEATQGDRTGPQVVLDVDAYPMSLDAFPGFGAGGDWEYVYCKVVASYKNFVVMANINDGSDPDNPYYPTMVWWSHPKDPGEFPTSDEWDYTDPTKLAGRFVVPSGSGEILAMKQLKDDLIIYTSNGMHRMSYVGGQLVFKFSKVTESSGILGYHCVDEVDGKHVIVTQDDVVLHDGQNGKSIAEGRVKKEMFSHQGSGAANTTTVRSITKDSEVWILFGDQASYNHSVKIPAKAYVWNYKEDTWSVYSYEIPNETRLMGDLCETEISDTAFARDDDEDMRPGIYGKTAIRELPTMPLDAQTTISSYDDYVGSYDASEDAYNTLVDVTYDWLSFMSGWACQSGGLMYAERQDYNDPESYGYADWDAFSTYPYMQLTKEGINLSDDETSNVITWIYPKIKTSSPVALRDNSSYSPVYITLGTQESAAADVVWEEPLLYWIGSSGVEVPRRMRTKLRGIRHAIKFETCAGGDLTVQGYDLVWEPSGDR